MKLEKTKTNIGSKVIKKTLLLTIVSGILLFSSCKKIKETTSVAPLSNDKSEEIHVCIEKNRIIQNNGARTDAAIIPSTKWQNGQTVRIKFLNNHPYLQTKVKQYAAVWLIHANLKFQYVGSNENADIKIGFKFNGDPGSWSYIGTDCKYIGQGEPSMNFGWLTETTSEQEFSRVITHEFGHALGLIHEHQSPTADIPWNKPYIYTYFAGPPNNWTAAQVDQNIFIKYQATQTNYSAFDTKSIMLYSFPKEFTTNGFFIQPNTVLSAVDIDYIGRWFPYDADRLLYRYFYQGHHFYTSSFYDLAYTSFENIVGRLFSYQKAGTSPLYRYINTNNGNRLSTTNYAELGSGIGYWAYEGVSGYVYTSNVPGTVPVFRYANSTLKDHFFTTNYSELGAGGNGGWVYQGIAFYLTSL